MEYVDLLQNLAIPPLEKLSDCARAIEDNDLILADSIFKEILTADEAERSTTRVVMYFVEALVRRAYKIYPQNPRPLVPTRTDLHAYMDFQFFPFFWFAQLSTYNTVWDALIGKSRVHLVDFSMMVSSFRCYFLMQKLAKQSSGPLSFRLTTIGPKLSKTGHYLQEIRQRIEEDARALKIDFEMKQLVANSTDDIVKSTLNLQRTSEDEAIVVKWEFELHKLLGMPGALEKVLSKLKDLKPEIMLIVEQEANHNGLNFLDWFPDSFQYYSVLFNSLDHDTFKDISHCKVLWEMHFRRQISSLMAREGINLCERHETVTQWRDRLSHAGFRPFRIWFKGKWFDDLTQYKVEITDRHPVLCRFRSPLVVTSAWKPDPTQANDGPVEMEGVGNLVSEIAGVNVGQADGTSCPQIEDSGMASYSEEEADDSQIMMEGNLWSLECTTINQIAVSAQIFDLLEYICHARNLPLALTWISDRRESSSNSNSNHILLIDNSACYLNDFTMKGFLDACRERHLEEGQGIAGKAVLSNNMNFVHDVSSLRVDDYPFVFEAWEFGLHAAVAFKLASVYLSSIDYVLEFFLPPEMNERIEQQLLIDGISSTLANNCRNAWIVSGVDLNRDDFTSQVLVEDQVGTSVETTAGVSGSSPAALSEVGSLNTNDRIMAWNMVIDDGREIAGPHGQAEEQNSIYGSAAAYANNEEIIGNSSRRRRRTSEVWNHFEEVRENGEVWAICKGCNNKYRGESKRGTSSLGRHVRSCPGWR